VPVRTADRPSSSKNASKFGMYNEEGVIPTKLSTPAAALERVPRRAGEGGGGTRGHGRKAAQNGGGSASKRGDRGQERKERVLTLSRYTMRQF